MRRIWLVRYRRGNWEEHEDWVAEEGLLEISLNQWGTRRLVFTPEQVRELVYGHLLSEGLIDGVQEVSSYHEQISPAHGSPGEVVRVEVRVRRAKAPFDPVGVVWPACGEEPGLPPKAFPPLEPRPLFPAARLVEIPRLVVEKTEDFRLTGAYHYAFLFSPELALMQVAKDIGRHNAVDKVIGAGLLAGQDLETSLLYLTGRVSSGIVLKALRAGIPMVASQGAALLGAIRLARRYRLGLVGFLRGQRFNLYSGQEWLA
ncbi:MAG TPA: formate dehydrogenase accessory sulfurtransferase FdhD [Candidatus Acetothermia bacterium]|nr:formate dehydrogenase accessory sulfurtransferase FdhD [Candidatus Acetothermia bacterium]